MATISIKVKRDVSLGYEVYRGSIKARELFPALWIDFYDQERNPYGYQRAFNRERSQAAANYAEDTPNAFWPECILAIRRADEEEDYQTSCTFTPVPNDNDFGVLTVEYNENRTGEIEGCGQLPWKRAFSQVDCQHRLGCMQDSFKSVTVCILNNITRLEEALVFKIINDTQKKMDSSLVDAITLLLQTGVLSDPALHMAHTLGTDWSSPLFRFIDMGGRSSNATYAVKLRTMKDCVIRLLAGKKNIAANVVDAGSYSLYYSFASNFWLAVTELWPDAFNDVNKKVYKLMTIQGLKGVSKYGGLICLAVMDDQDISVQRIKGFFPQPNLVDWRAGQPYLMASGNTGISMVFNKLVEVFGRPYNP